MWKWYYRPVIQSTHRCDPVCGQSRLRHYLNGLLLETEGVLRAIATDGHRLAVTSEPIDQELQKKQLIIPRKSVAELVRLFDQQEENPNRILRHLFQSFHSNRYALLTCKLIDGRFPDYNRVLPKGGDKIITVERDALRQSLLRASILSNEKFRGVDLTYKIGCC